MPYCNIRRQKKTSIISISCTPIVKCSQSWKTHGLIPHTSKRKTASNFRALNLQATSYDCYFILWGKNSALHNADVIYRVAPKISSPTAIWCRGLYWSLFFCIKACRTALNIKTLYLSDKQMIWGKNCSQLFHAQLDPWENPNKEHSLKSIIYLLSLCSTSLHKFQTSKMKCLRNSLSTFATVQMNSGRS